MDNSQKAIIAREWIIFAVSVGLGGHVALGLMLHAPDIWPWNKAGVHGLLIGLSVYVMVQVLRSFWWAVTGNRRSQKAGLGTDDDPFS
ncbi:MAG: hypothetical protein ACREJU_13880 [Nitrospiraceae bacterium]